MYKLSKDLAQFSYKKIEDVANKRVIIRSCLNVAIDKEGNMTEDTRYQEALPLIKELAQNAKTLIVTAHLGRPEYRTPELSFRNNVFKALSDELRAMGKTLILAEELDTLRSTQGDNNVYLIDNIRFFPGEESKDKEVRMNFAKELAGLADVYINDAFADYREAASTYDIATILPSYLGPVFTKEVESLASVANPKRPFVAILGGAKLSEKLDALKSLAEVADTVIIGGAMAYTLMRAQGMNIGNSLVEDDKLDVAKEIMSQFGSKLVLPLDHMTAPEFSKDAPHEFTTDAQIPEDQIAIDIGPKSIENAKAKLANAATILWNGPLGIFEWDHSAAGTMEVGKAIAANSSAYKLAGGGDSIAAINKLGLTGFNHISTGGGAMLAFIAYDKFPVLDVIVNK